MKPMVLVGILLVVFGAVVLFRGLTYKSQRNVLRVGNLEATVEERKEIPTWVGVVGIVGGLALIAAAGRPRPQP